MAIKCYLRVGADYLDEAIKCPSIKFAIGEFQAIAQELDNYGQRIEASIHIANKRSEIAEYPDYVISLGPRGGVKKEST